MRDEGETMEKKEKLHLKKVCNNGIEGLVPIRGQSIFKFSNFDRQGWTNTDSMFEF